MLKNIVNTLELFSLIPNAEAARLYLETRLWPEGAACPSCALRDRITNRKGGFYRCNLCKLDFTVRTAAIFDRSHVPLHKWVYAMYLVVTVHEDVSSAQVARKIGVTRKTASFMLRRIGEAFDGKAGNDNLEELIDIVLAYRPRPATKAAKKRARKTNKIQKLLNPQLETH